MVLRFLGEATTDANGLAVLSDGYVGTGAGLVDIIAKTTIDESTIVSTPYEVLDAIFYDDGTNENWTNRSANPMTIDRTGDYVLITAPSSSYGQYTANATVSGDCTVEFNFYFQSNASCYVNVCGANFDLKTFAGEDCTAKIIVSDGTATFYKNGTANPSTKSISSATTVLFQINSGGANIGYDNFKIYPI